MGKTCSKCNEDKELSQFYKRSPKAGGGLEAFCKKCKAEYYKRDRRWGHLYERYKITKEQYEQLFDSQEGRCAICDENSTDGVLAVDHCHSSGDIRGLLCKNCNSAIGLLGDTSESVFKAYNYLRRYNESIDTK